ncbi:MAG TPA: serine/threonine-protein kinase, partial [Polyangia bacterium]
MTSPQEESSVEVEIDELFGRIEPNSPCLVGDAFWRFVQGGMPPAEVVAIERHLVVCESCTGAVAAAASELSPPLSRISGAQSSGTTGSSFPLFVPFSEALARYAVKGILGVGGMGVVYEGLDRETGRRVAIKTVRAASLDALSALRQEIGILRRMKHPGVVAVLDDGVAGSDPWYAMELLEGETLAARNDSLWQRDSGAEAVTLPGDGASPSVARPGASAEDRAAGGRLPEVLGLYARLCEPLAFVHAAGIVHGDLKPGNVFIRAEEQPVLMDFGLSSRASGRLGRETMDVGGRFRGTLAYVAPEQIVGGFADARADLYALGCMLYESVTGRPPFEATTPARIKEMHLKEAPLPASARVEGIPAALDQLIQRLLAKDPVDRVVSADDVGGALRGLLPAQAGRARAPDTLVDLPDAKPAAPVYL